MNRRRRRVVPVEAHVLPAGAALGGRGGLQSRPCDARRGSRDLVNGESCGGRRGGRTHGLLRYRVCCGGRRIVVLERGLPRSCQARLRARRPARLAA